MDDEAIKWMVLGMAIASSGVRSRLKGKSLGCMKANHALIESVVAEDPVTMKEVLKGSGILKDKDENLVDVFLRVFAEMESTHAMKQVGAMAKTLEPDAWLDLAKKKIQEIEQWRKK